MKKKKKKKRKKKEENKKADNIEDEDNTIDINGEIKKEELETEIEEILDKKRSTTKYDISEKNENSFIYKLFERNKTAYILEDKSIKNKNKVKSTFIRFIFVNLNRFDRDFRAKIQKKKSMKKIVNLNHFNLEIILDTVKENDISNFHSIYRLKGDLPFIKNENMVISIDFNE